MLLYFNIPYEPDEGIHRITIEDHDRTLEITKVGPRKFRNRVDEDKYKLLTGLSYETAPSLWSQLNKHNYDMLQGEIKAIQELHEQDVPITLKALSELYGKSERSLERSLGAVSGRRQQDDDEVIAMLDDQIKGLGAQRLVVKINLAAMARRKNEGEQIQDEEDISDIIAEVTSRAERDAAAILTQVLEDVEQRLRQAEAESTSSAMKPFPGNEL
jgi:hypothetical protein